MINLYQIRNLASIPSIPGQNSQKNSSRIIPIQDSPESLWKKSTHVNRALNANKTLPSITPLKKCTHISPSKLMIAFALTCLFFAIFNLSRSSPVIFNGTLSHASAIDLRDSMSTVRLHLNTVQTNKKTLSEVIQELDSFNVPYQTKRDFEKERDAYASNYLLFANKLNEIEHNFNVWTLSENKDIEELEKIQSAFDYVFSKTVKLINSVDATLAHVVLFKNLFKNSRSG